MIKIQDYLDGEAGVDLLEAALARILDEELDLVPLLMTVVLSG